MPSFIVIESSKETDFNVEARSVLQSEKYSEINQGTYMGTSGSPSTIKTKLKNLPSYKKAGTGLRAAPARPIHWR